MGVWITAEAGGGDQSSSAGVQEGLRVQIHPAGRGLWWCGQPTSRRGNLPFSRKCKSSCVRGRTGGRVFDLREPRQTPTGNDFAATTSPQTRSVGLIPSRRARARATPAPPTAPPELSATPRKGRQRRGSRSPTKELCARTLRSSSVQKRPSPPTACGCPGGPHLPRRSSGGFLIADEPASLSDALCRLQRGSRRLQLVTRGGAQAAVRAAAGRACAVPVGPHGALREWRIGTSIANGDSMTAQRETSVV